jgi:hypothetical protein
VWAAQAYLNLVGLAASLPQDNITRGTIERFTRQAPPSIKVLAAAAENTRRLGHSDVPPNSRTGEMAQ